MAKKKEEQSIEIIGAKIKDDFCNYDYRVTKGIGMGDVHNVKGKSIIDDDMKSAFERFNVHMAVIDDIFKHAKVDIDNVDNFHNHEFVGLYHVTGFKLSGGEDDRSIILYGTKYVSLGGRFDVESPKIAIDKLSGYKWYNELKEAADSSAMEVSLYKGGKCTAVEEEPADNPKQLKISAELEKDLQDAKL